MYIDIIVCTFYVNLTEQKSDRAERLFISVVNIYEKLLLQRGSTCPCNIQRFVLVVKNENFITKILTFFLFLFKT